MFKITKNNLVYFVSFFALLAGLSFVSLLAKGIIFNIIRRPSIILAYAQREIDGFVFYHRNLVENEALRKDSALLRQKIHNLNEVYLENMRLKSLLSLKQKSPLKVVAARVIGTSADSWSSAVLIDKGLHHGIRRNMVVMDYLGLVGRIVESSQFTSKVMLITDPNMGVSGLVQRTRQEGLVSGTLGENLVMRYLPEETDIAVSDTIVTSGSNSIYPKGLLIGKVVDVGSEFSGLSRYATIRPVARLSSIEEVLVVVE